MSSSNGTSAWDRRFYAVAEQVAEWSKDPRRRVGAVVVKDKRILSTGYNGFPAGLSDSLERLNDKETKLSLTVHAELNALLSARVSLEGSTLYVTYPPCNHCALAIVQSGVARVVSPKPNPNSSWLESQTRSLAVFKECGVEYEPLLHE